ncbi:MAG: energy transducer TonB [Deltaproteobacteria bacterium]|nr:energy transducer TonB [Deltaproteobacteria bacterium]
MTIQASESEWGWKSWSAVVLASAALHGLLLGIALWWSREVPLPRRVVTVEAICLTTGSGHAGGGTGRVCEVKPQVPPQPQPPKPQAVKEKPKSRPLRTVSRPPEVEPPPALSMPRPAAATPPGPVAAALPGSGSGLGTGAGSGPGSGRGRGPGSGTDSGAGPGTEPGSGSGSGVALKSYLAEVRRLLERHKNYPWMARRQHREGVVVLKFTIGKDGAIADHAIASSSGHEILDSAAQETLRKVGRFPPLPAVLNRSQLTIQVPLTFRLAES